jgi:D-amino-acid dehydrogenase
MRRLAGESAMDQVAGDRVFYNTGHGHLGWTLSAVTAEMVADSVAGSRVVNGASGAGSVMAAALKMQGAH